MKYDIHVHVNERDHDQYSSRAMRPRDNNEFTKSNDEPIEMNDLYAEKHTVIPGVPVLPSAPVRPGGPGGPCSSGAICSSARIVLELHPHWPRDA